MTLNPKLSLVAAQVQATALAPLANGGFLDIYASAQPSTPETTPGGTALATFALPATFASSITNGVITANAITGVTIANTGTAVWFRVTESNHSTPLFDGSCGTATADLVLNATALVSGATLTISSFTYSMPGL